MSKHTGTAAMAHAALAEEGEPITTTALTDKASPRETAQHFSLTIEEENEQGKEREARRDASRESSAR
jgi:hypothetical protein